MNVAFVYDDPGYRGGAELTMEEFAAAVPEGVSLTAPDEAEVVVVGNCFLIGAQSFDAKVVRFVHDTRGPGPIDSETRIFYSPLQRDRVGLAGELCPPILDRDRFRPNRQTRKHREGACTIGTFGHFGKGQQALKEWAAENGPLNVYGSGPLLPSGPGIIDCGELAPEMVPTALWRHRSFVHLPSEVEAYGRGVAEAWAAGCELIVNRNVGALHWIENEPEALDDAAARFWEIVTNA